MMRIQQNDITGSFLNNFRKICKTTELTSKEHIRQLKSSVFII